MSKNRGGLSLDSIDPEQLAEIIPHIAGLLSSYNKNPTQLMLEQKNKMTQKEQDESMFGVREQLIKFYSQIRQDKELSYEELTQKANSTGFRATSTELTFRGEGFPLPKVEVKPFYLPTIFGLQDGRLIDFLKSGKYVNKRVIESTASKVRSHFKLPPKFSNNETLAEFGFASPDLFHLPNDSIYKANPTYTILNKCLDNLNLPNLMTAENRTHYTSNDDASKRVLSRLSEINLKPEAPHLLLNVVLMATDKLKNEEEIALPTQNTDKLNNFLLLTYCASLLIGSVTAISAVVYQMPTLAAISSNYLPTKVEAKTHLNSILSNKGETKLAYSLFTKVNPYSPSKYGLIEPMYLNGADRYINEFFEAKTGINEILVDLAINNKSQLNSIKTMYLAELIGRLLEELHRPEIIDLVRKVESIENKSPNQERLVDGFKSVVLETLEAFEERSEGFCFSDDFQVPNKLIINMKLAISCTEKVSKQIGKINEKQSELNFAHRNDNYSRMIQLAQELKEVDYTSILGELSEHLIICFKAILERHSINGRIIELRNIDGDIEDNREIIKDDRQIKELKSQNHQLSKKNTQLEQRNQELIEQISIKQTQIDTMTKSEALRSTNRLSEIERKFMFGEKTSVSDAIAIIRSRLPYVSFADNINEQIEVCQYANTQKLLKFMYLLCEDYFSAITSGKPDTVAKDILGQVFRANESPTVLGNQKLKRQRIFMVNGEETLFTKHINIGQSRDLKNSCSIYFDIDSSPDKPSITIGYIGAHLENTLT
ncbi:hypothetical protein QTV49_004615 [Vibrio vulnificus]|nr:hypothetical protein [Vibrio vulnificus]